MTKGLGTDNDQEFFLFFFLGGGVQIIAKSLLGKIIY